MMKNMKKLLNIGLIGLFGVLCLTACSDDNDSNPTLDQGDGTFVLNVPEYAENNVVDLKNSTFVNLTTSQPNYGGVPYSTTYAVEISLDEVVWTDLPTTYTTTKIAIAAKEFNNAILTLSGEEPDFSAPIPVYVRLLANINATNESYGHAESNSVKLPNVLAYIPDANAEVPETMFMTGSFPAGGGDWSVWVKFNPVYDKPGFFYTMVYIPAGGEFKINPESKWGGKEKGFNQVNEINDLAGAGVGPAGDDSNCNFKIANGGWYTIFVRTEIDKGELVYKFYMQEPNVYIFGNANGGTWDYSPDWKFEVPADENGFFVSPALTASGEVRIALQLQGIDWWRTELTLKDGATIYYRNENIADNWEKDKGPEYSIPGDPGKKVYLNFTTNTGKCE